MKKIIMSAVVLMAIGAIVWAASIPITTGPEDEVSNTSVPPR